MKKIMLLGYGAMAQAVIERMPEAVAIGWIVAHEHHHAGILARFHGTVIPLLSPGDCADTPDLVLECASQQAVAQYGEAILRRGWHLAVVSTGALADRELEARLRNAGGRLTLLSGAVAGIDGLSAAKEGGLQRVVYRSRKSPASWRGSHAEKLINLDTVSSAQIFFEGSAREAARLFPANANVAATVALGGIGMDETRVQLMVDPTTTRNTHTLHVEGLFGEFHIELSGLPLASNPKTSTLAALSAVRACRELAQQ
ncbi:aspartate dehydrogenase [Yokenella regensburgei]|uniref:aspartate dehydrogenase n=1 Tax=Yokenella regensburgei TaxID=158877 RepID=UPI0020777C37|nr:aspartate dehydrogenase [Yokenella regensburgei]